MAQSGNDRLNTTVSSGTGATTLGPYVLPSNLLVDISILMTNGATAPTTPAQVVLQWRYVTSGAWHSLTIIGSNVNSEERGLQNKILGPGVYEYQYVYTGGDDQNVDFVI